MYYVFNLANGKETFYTSDIDKKQALKTTYALENRLASQLATNFEALMVRLEKEVIETGKYYSIGDYTVIK